MEELQSDQKFLCMSLLFGDVMVAKAPPAGTLLINTHQVGESPGQKGEKLCPRKTEPNFKTEIGKMTPAKPSPLCYHSPAA